MRKIPLLFSFLFVLMLTSQIFAGSTGKLAGRVTDGANGDGLPFANVFIAGTNLGAATDVDGYFTVLNIPPGVYTVTASIVGYQKQTVTDVRVNVDFTTRLNFELNTGSIEMAAVIVQGERNPLIREDLTNPVVAISAETIQELPVDQIDDVIRLQAGIVVGDNGTIHIRGGRADETSYSLNGVSINDPLALETESRRSVGLATNAVQEVSVSSGTFSAEYGNALSGIVNYVTKEGSENYTFSLRGYVGDYLTSRDNLYPNVDDIDPMNRSRMEATFGGPIPLLNRKVKVFFSGVFEDFKGLKNGTRYYNPSDSYLSREAFQTGDDRKAESSKSYWFNPYSSTSTGAPTGDGSYVSMDPSTSFNLQGNIIYNLSSTFKLRYEAVHNSSEWKGYEMAYKFNPDGLGTNYSEGLIQTFDITHTVSDNMFYTLKASRGYSSSKYYLYEDINDPRYLPSVYRLGVGNSGFYAGGTDNNRSSQRTETTTLKGDLVSQLFKSHEIKAGFETRFHNINFESYDLKIRDANGNNITNADLLYDNNLTIVRSVPDPNTEPSLITKYERNPVDAAIYVQDKIELAKTLILNIGLRYEYFDPKASYNPFLSSDLENIKINYINKGETKSEIKHHVSPRISVSYPITAEGVIRFSYGHFYQNGSLRRMYRNPEFFVTAGDATPTFGNSNVNMQKSVQYEFGLQQQLSENIKMELTGYYKDVKDYIYTQTIYTTNGIQYQALTNLAYANVRGVTVHLEKRRAPQDLFYSSLDYTFQVSEGNRTEPTEDMFFSESAGKQTETYLVPLGFDRPHNVNLSMGLFDANNWSLGVIGYMRAGEPYTPAYPSDIVGITFEQNSANQPFQWSVDLKFEKFFQFDPIKFSLFLQVENLFDTQNELTVYQSTGRSLKSIESSVNPALFQSLKDRINRGDVGMFPIDEIDNYYNWRPERVSRPREIRLGFSLLFN